MKVVMKSVLYGALAFIFFVLVSYLVVQNYSFIFSRKVTGLIISADRVPVNISLLQGSGDNMNPQMFSFAIAIRQDDGEIVTASAEDRQWAAAQRGLCAEAVYFPYPPWKLMKSGTYYGARLDRLFECPEKAKFMPKSFPAGSSAPSTRSQGEAVEPPAGPPPPQQQQPGPQNVVPEPSNQPSNQ